jgi:hypothetical protein
VIDAIKRSPLMLELAPGARGLKAVSSLDDALIVASCVLLMRVEGLFDAKELVRSDASVSEAAAALLCALLCFRGTPRRIALAGPFGAGWVAGCVLARVPCSRLLQRGGWQGPCSGGRA